MHEIYWIISPKKHVKATKKIRKLNKQHKGKKWDEYTEDYKDLFIKKGLPSLLFFVWMIVGVLSFNWILFLAMLIFNVGFINLISKPFRYNNIYVAIHWINSIIGFMFGVFVLINSYHLKIDTFEFVKQLLGF